MGSGGDESIVRDKPTKSFDFRQPKTLERTQVRSIEMLLESFARPASTLLGANLRVASRIEILGTAQKLWEEILGELSGVGSVSVFYLVPLPSKVVLFMPASLALKLVDLRLGGVCDQEFEPRVPTDIEQSIILGVLGEVLPQLSNAFSPIIETKFERLNSEQALQFVQGIPLNEMCLSVNFNVSIGELGAEEITMIFPFPALRPLVESLGSRGHALVEKQSEEFHKGLKTRLQDVEVDVEVLFKPIQLTSGEIIRLVPGDVVSLGHRVSDPLDLIVDGAHLYKGRPTRVGSRLAVLIVEE
ncbi:Type III flagellar switch regulator (C-ring) FliN C-term [Ferrithrix thermotolerans DSM 19514]|uniref:Flagellar motor switch protein FliM n=1 Tax=Ferrithrix thermotolerans DSM 19514 TaxID=1121881 RepID=A0A1M4W9J0_9ACTN|nr:FliM/FliN family flagellar motor switch protein [Ferrithrix thermotolerans]SHE77753.1 Type III flagellar switch regulator (C-ring) FliN C-term [Ferrithrix thermotolerans DSM 19514]